MLLDANLLIYAVDEVSPHHQAANLWLSSTLGGERRVGLPWQSIGAFVRIITHHRVTTAPLSAAEAWACVKEWLDIDVTWVPPASEHTAAILGELLDRHGVTGNLVPDAQLAALAIEHGLVVMSADTDFARFPEVRWENPPR